MTLRQTALPLAILLVTAATAATAHAGPTVKKSRWVHDTVYVRNQVENAWQFFAVPEDRAELQTPVCAAGEVPLLMSAKAVAQSVWGNGLAQLPPEALGSWSLTAADRRSGQKLLARGRGAEVSAKSEAGIPWTQGNLSITTDVMSGMDRELRNAVFAVELTMTCGRTDTQLAPMYPAAP